MEYADKIKWLKTHQYYLDGERIENVIVDDNAKFFNDYVVYFKHFAFFVDELKHAEISGDQITIRDHKYTCIQKIIR
jgi:hypothetical protein